LRLRLRLSSVMWKVVRSRHHEPHCEHILALEYEPNPELKRGQRKDVDGMRPSAMHT